MPATHDIAIRSITVWHRPDEDPDLSWLEQDCFAHDGYGAARLASYGHDWHMIGIVAEAEITVAGVIQTITSGGLWGIESDSSDDYLREVADEELAALRDILVGLGFAADAIDGAAHDAR